MDSFHTLKITSRRPETRDAVSFALAVPPALGDAFKFTHGQYLTLKATIGGTEERRSYSISNAVQDGKLEITIKKVPDGRFSRWACDELAEGSEIAVAPPAGRFHAPLSPDAAHRYLAIAAGSGITPIYSIIRTTLLAEPQSEFTLIYGNRSTPHVIFREALLELKDMFPTRFNLIFVMSREPQDVPLFFGRIDGEKIEAIARTQIDLDVMDNVFICGPQAMADDVAAALEHLGYDARKIKRELFGTGPLPAGAARPARAEDAPVDEIPATVKIDGQTRSFTIDKNHQTVLEAAQAHGIELPYSCKAGVCSTCVCKVVEGEVEMDRNFALEDYELARGFVLACQSRPVSATLAIDYDERI